MDPTPHRTPSNARTFTLPIPLPPEMRTRRSLARRISLSIILLWAVSYCYGVLFLYREDAKPSTVVDVLLRQGVHEWGIFVGQSDHCSGYLKSSLVKKDSPRFSLSGNLVVSGEDKSQDFRFHSDLSFGKFYQLDKVDADANLGEQTWSLRSDDKHPEMLLLSNVLGNQQRDLTLSIPHPSFLGSRGNKNFRLTFAKENELERLLKYDDSTKSFHHGQLQLRILTTNDAALCRTQLEDPTSIIPIPNSLFHELNAARSLSGGQ